ncbi:PQQ-dependent sugar dehydrogenase [Streptomyces physcomitrii]|uniref:PQQ-dependent sugar dehydrogenase n=1 Tax=Streptomyces physcomitrii TaxID=2724184 RepID=UPI0033FC8159
MSVPARTRKRAVLAAVSTALLAAAGLGATGAAAAPPAGAAGEPTEVSTLSTGWSIPWGVSWLPDASAALVTERDSFGLFSVTPDGTRTELGTVPESETTGGEGGLMGVAADPEWETNHRVYVMHTSSEGNRIARMTWDGSSLGEYTVLLDGIAKNRYHNGGRLAFGPDGYLYATTGDAQDSALAQDENSLNGKILRMTTDGEPAPDNPFGNHVYSLGHRNPQGIAFDAQGRLWEAELGENTHDELNLIKPGANYGWPQCEGDCEEPGTTNPKYTWSTAEASPSGIAVVDNAVYMASLRGERLWRIPLDENSEEVGEAKAFYVGTYGRLRSATKVPGAEELWLSTTNADGNGGRPPGSDTLLRVTIG